MRHASTLPAILIAATLLPVSAFAAIPQLDPTWYGSQLFWLALCFFALVAVVRGSIAPKIGHVLHVRATAIADAMKEASAFRARAVGAASDMESGLVAAKETAAQMLLQMNQAAQTTAQATTEQLDHTLKTQLSHAEKRIADAKQTAISGLESAATELSAAMAEKLLGVSINADVARKATKHVA
jgi:F-type H+-transporting ATPase subunit b